MKILRRFSKRWVLAAAMFGSLVVSLLGPGASGRLRRATEWALAPLSDGMMFLTARFKSRLGRVGRESIWPQEARRLQEENEALRFQLRTLRWEQARRMRQAETSMALEAAVRRAHRRLSRQLYVQDLDFPCHLIPARVVMADSLPYGRTRTVNAGRRRGAEPGLRVTTRRLLTDRSKWLPDRLATITAQALVGRLAQTGAFTARLQLLTDRGFKIRAKVYRKIDPKHPRRIQVTAGGRAALQTLTPRNNSLIDVEARGDGVAALKVPHVAKNHQVRPGDWLVTSDREDNMPIGVRIGKVADVADDPDHPTFVTLRVEPSADLETLREVYIIVPLRPEL